jgi:hypothetical protein
MPSKLFIGDEEFFFICEGEAGKRIMDQLGEGALPMRWLQDSSGRGRGEQTTVIFYEIMPINIQ